MHSLSIKQNERCNDAARSDHDTSATSSSSKVSARTSLVVENTEDSAGRSSSPTHLNNTHILRGRELERFQTDHNSPAAEKLDSSSNSASYIDL